MKRLNGRYDALPNDTQHNDIQHNDIQHNDTQHYGGVVMLGAIYAECHLYWKPFMMSVVCVTYNTYKSIMLSGVIPSVIILSVVAPLNEAAIQWNSHANLTTTLGLP